MSRIGIRKPSPALAVAMLALLIALSGTAYAAITLPAHSVGTKQLKNGAVTLTKIASSAQHKLLPTAWADVRGDGTLEAGHAVHDSVGHTTSSGIYTLTLNHSVEDCAAVASESPNPGAHITGGVAQATVVGKHLTVSTQYYDSGFFLGDENFSVVVYC